MSSQAENVQTNGRTAHRWSGDHADHGYGACDANGAADVDVLAIEEAVHIILRAIGENPDRPGLVDTPSRVAGMYAEMFSGLRTDPARHMKVTFPEQYDEIVLVRDIPFTSICEHHLLPFSGTAHIAYIPDGNVVGLSKLARVIEEVAHRPQVQERMTCEVASLIQQYLRPQGTAVFIAHVHVDPGDSQAGQHDSHLSASGGV